MDELIAWCKHLTLYFFTQLSLGFLILFHYWHHGRHSWLHFLDLLFSYRLAQFGNIELLVLLSLLSMRVVNSTILTPKVFDIIANRVTGFFLGFNIYIIVIQHYDHMKMKKWLTLFSRKWIGIYIALLVSLFFQESSKNYRWWTSWNS